MTEDKVKARIIELLPEIRDYEYGMDYCDEHDMRTSVFVDCKNCKPSARSITFVDVLLAMSDEKHFMLTVFPDGRVSRKLHCEGRPYPMWDLNITDYDNQTPEVRAFIGTLLGV